eukprot:363120-Chlamydomonas_euryale.AAC.1
MHTRFEATVHHADSGRGSGAGGGSGCGTTRFLALDKCMPGRKFLTVRAATRGNLGSGFRVLGIGSRPGESQSAAGWGEALDGADNGGDRVGCPVCVQTVWWARQGGEDRRAVRAGGL